MFFPLILSSCHMYISKHVRPGTRLTLIPTKTGLTCVREIRKKEEQGEIVKHVPVIAVTANVRDQQVATAKESGMDDVLSKPFRIPDLLKKVEVLLLGETAQAEAHIP